MVTMFSTWTKNLSLKAKQILHYSCLFYQGTNDNLESRLTSSYPYRSSETLYEAYGGEADHTKSMFKYEEDQELEVK